MTDASLRTGMPDSSDWRRVCAQARANPWRRGRANLRHCRKAMALVNDVYTTTKTFPKDEVWGLTSQIRRAGVSIASNIAEGSKRPDDDFRRFLSYSLGSLAELDTQLIIAEMQGYAPYAHEMKSRIIGLMAAIRKFAAALRK